MKKYEKLKLIYPEFVSKQQLYKICSISPRSAEYLLKNGIIPSCDTGKHTWRYKIALSDVITYLRRREQLGSMIPTGAVNSRSTPKKEYASFSSVVSPGNEYEVSEYFTHICSSYPDVLSTQDITKMTGVAKTSVINLINSGELKSLVIGKKYLVPKSYLLEFVSTPRYIEYSSSSEELKAIIRGFEAWKSAKSLQ